MTTRSNPRPRISKKTVIVKKSRIEQAEKPTRTSKFNDDSQSERPFKSDRFNKPEKSNRSDRFEQSNRPSRFTKSSSSDKPVKILKLKKRGNNDDSNISSSTTVGKTKILISKNKDNTVRLNRYIANTGLCSRREADEYIAAGVITINGKVVTELGTKVSPLDEVKFNGERLQSEKKVYILLNKPKDYVTTMDDPHAKRTVMELVQNACKERIYPVGRLDRNTTGLLLLTNDGDLTKKLTHPKFKKKKIYHVFLDKQLTKSDMDKMVAGFELEDGFINADKISYVDEVDKKQIGIEIHSGQNRVVRRMFEHLNYRVIKLDRVYFAGLTKKSLTRGKWRFLTEKEIVMLKMNSFI